MHTIESLRGVFNPFPTAPPPAQQHGQQQHSSQQQQQQHHSTPASQRPPLQASTTPRESVQRTREWARRSILQSAGLLSESAEVPSRQKRPRDGHQQQEEEEDSTSSSEEEDEEGSSGSDTGSTTSTRPATRSQAQQQQQQQPGVARGTARCFLCDYCTSQEVRFITTFISDNIANMEVTLMAEQIRKYIFDKRPEYSQGSHGLEVPVIRRHIREHMLSPTVRIADMMRHLLKLCDTLRGNLERVDPDTGESTADRSNIDTYLKVVTKVLDMYKMSETNKMLFSNAEK